MVKPKISEENPTDRTSLKSSHQKVKREMVYGDIKFGLDTSEEGLKPLFKESIQVM